MRRRPTHYALEFVGGEPCTSLHTFVVCCHKYFVASCWCCSQHTKQQPHPARCLFTFFRSHFVRCTRARFQQTPLFIPVSINSCLAHKHNQEWARKLHKKKKWNHSYHIQIQIYMLNRVETTAELHARTRDKFLILLNDLIHSQFRIYPESERESRWDSFWICWFFAWNMTSKLLISCTRMCWSKWTECVCDSPTSSILMHFVVVRCWLLLVSSSRPFKVVVVLSFFGSLRIAQRPQINCYELHKTNLK